EATPPSPFRGGMTCGLAAFFSRSIAYRWQGTLKASVARASPPTASTRSPSAPDFLGDLDRHAQLGPLFFLRQHVAFFAGGKAALRAQAQLVEVDEFCGFVDAPPDRIPRLELPGLGGDQPEHHGAVLRYQPQRLEAAGALGVVFHEIAVHLDAVEQ